ncbi:MAG: aspartate dehydrogenase [Rhizobiaceae bacterium]
MKIALIGKGAIAQYVHDAALGRGHDICAFLVKDEAVHRQTNYIATPADLPSDTDFVIDCAGHHALAQYGVDVLARGIDMISLSIGALADQKLRARLEQTARSAGVQLHLASGAVGGLDCLKSASVGKLKSVTYLARKPPAGWKGSPAEAKLVLDSLSIATTHFEGTARQAAISYPHNANVAAAVALAGVGFDDTKVRLIADPTITENIHEIRAEGDFGRLEFQICGKALPDNPRSSALAAMSVLSKLEQIAAPIAI